MQRWRSKGQNVRFQVDSGATCNVVSKNDLPDECWIAHSKQVLSMFNGSKMETIGKCRVNLVNPKVDEECEAEFVGGVRSCPAAFPRILSASSLDQQAAGHLSHLLVGSCFLWRLFWMGLVLVHFLLTRGQRRGFLSSST